MLVVNGLVSINTTQHIGYHTLCNAVDLPGPVQAQVRVRTVGEPDVS